jgi:hypothetical protein
MPERLLAVARQLAEMKTDDMDELNRSVHMRDLKTVILRLLERIEARVMCPHENCPHKASPPSNCLWHACMARWLALRKSRSE